jgi:hypothetical protein
VLSTTESGKLRVPHPSVKPILTLIVLTLFTSCECARRGQYTVPTINDQTPSSVTITGPATLSPGQTGTYTVSVTYPSPLSPDIGLNIPVRIYEDDYVGDVQLDRRVFVTIPQNEASGSATFELTCRTQDDGTVLLEGDDDSDEHEDPWHIYGHIEADNGYWSANPTPITGEKSGDNYEVSCEVE